MRPRGWHLFEKHLVVDGRPVPGGIFDFALYFFHNVKELLARGSGPYFYLPKMQSHLEARLWNDVFLDAQVHDPAKRAVETYCTRSYTNTFLTSHSYYLFSLST